MASGQLQTVIGQLRRLVGRRSGCTLTDAQLVNNFASRRDEASFEVLVWRHGSMVYRLCQRILGDSHAAEDAFQAAFLVLARKAGAIGQGEAVGSWLYKVAYRIALRVRARATRHGADNNHAELLDEAPARDMGDAVLWRDLRPVLDEEIDRLPEKYRTPFVLCYLEGHTNEEAAAQLGCPKGTILSRLARGRERLRSRLTQRGLALSTAGLAAALSQSTASAMVPAALVNSTTEAAIIFAAGKATAGLISAPVVALSQGVLNAMFLTKVKIAAAALVALAILGFGVGSAVHWAQADAPDSRGSAVAENEQDRVSEVAGADQKAPAGKVLSVAKDGKGFTLQIAGRPDEEAAKLFIKTSDKTAISYQNVGPNGAVPTEGYRAKVKLEENKTDVAASVVFHGPAASRDAPDIMGKVIGVAKDGKGITLEGAAKRDEEPKKVEIQFNDKTLILFTGVSKGEAKLTEGLKASVQLLNGAKGNVAAIVTFHGTETVESRDGPAADATGKIVSVAQDGKTITVEAAGANRDEAPKNIDIKLTDKTAVVYHQVGVGGTKIAAGMKTRVWLADGSKDTAAKLAVAALPKERWAQVSGKVVGISKDGGEFTVEVAGKSREDDAKTITIKLSIDTKIAYNGVGPGEAKLTEGFQAHVRLMDGSAETAYQVSFTKPAEGGGGR